MGRRKKEINDIVEKPSGFIDGAMPKPVSCLPTAPDPTPAAESIADPEPKIEKEEKKSKKSSNGCFEVPNYNGFSLIEALRKIKVDPSFINRKRIAEANGNDNYLGLGKDNKEMLEKLLKGELKMP